MALSSRSLVKYFFAFVNHTLIVVGIPAVILFGFLLTASLEGNIAIKQGFDYILYFAYLCLFIAVLISAIAFFGCMGAIKESRCMLATYICFIFIVLVAEISAGIYFSIKKDELSRMARAYVARTVQEEYGVVKGKTEIIDTIHTRFECCGAESPTDWLTSKYNSKDYDDRATSETKTSTFMIPKSCCKKKPIYYDECKEDVRFTTGKLKVVMYPPLIHVKGCTDMLVAELHNNMFIILTGILGIFFVELLVLLTSIYLYTTICYRDELYPHEFRGFS